jgi:hypothetical protein
LSDFFFLLCVEGLSSLLRHEEESGGLQGFLVFQGASISHLLFTDSSLILMKVDASNAYSLESVVYILC